MNKWFQRANERLSLGSAAALLAGTALLGQILGVFRVSVINGYFKALGTQSTDAYFAASKIPDFIYFTIAAGALGVAFMPILSDRLAKGDRKGSWELTSSLLNFLAIVMGLLAIIILIFARQLIQGIVAPEMSPVQLDNAVAIMRLMSLNPLLFAISAVLSSVQQSFGRFFFYATAPLFYNIAMIASVYIFGSNLGIVGLGIGAFIGGVLQLIVVCCGLVGMNVRYSFKIMWKNTHFRQVLKQLPPRSIDQGIDQINSIAETRFARRLGEGYISYYENALTLHNAPTALIGTAISTAAFPHFTERLSQGRPDLFRKEFLMVLRAMIWISLPVAVLSFFSRDYLARIIFKQHAPEIALIFGYLCAAILFRTLYSIISRYFYAQKNNLIPLLVSLFAIGLNIILAYKLSRPKIDGGYGVEGLAIAQSIVAASEVVILVTVMVARNRTLFNLHFIGGLMKMLSVTGFTVLVAFILVSLFPLEPTDRGIIIMVKLGIISTITLVVHVGISSLLDLEESRPVLNKVRRILFRPVRIQ